MENCVLQGKFILIEGLFSKIDYLKYEDIEQAKF